jgi:hypothetical protein
MSNFIVLLIFILAVPSFAEVPERAVYEKCVASAPKGIWSEQVKKILAPCFSNLKSPFVISVGVQIHQSHFSPTYFKNLGVFFSDEDKNNIESCVTKCLESTKPQRTDNFAAFAPVIPEVNLEVVRTAKDQSITYASKELCSTPDAALEKTDQKPLRGSAMRPMPVGKQNMEVAEALKPCTKVLPKGFKPGIYVGSSEHKLFSSNGKQKLTELNIELSGLNKSYTECLSKALFPFQAEASSQLGIKALSINGEAQPMLPYSRTRREWFVLVYQKGEPLYYQWTKLEDE